MQIEYIRLALIYNNHLNMWKLFLACGCTNQMQAGFGLEMAVCYSSSVVSKLFDFKSLQVKKKKN